MPTSKNKYKRINKSSYNAHDHKRSQTIILNKKDDIEIPTVVNEEEIPTIISDEIKPFPVVTVVLCIICTFLFLFMIYNMVLLNELNSQQSILESQLETLVDEKKDLEYQVDQKNDLREIEQLAVDEYGMIKKETAEKVYISIEVEEKNEVVDD